MPVSILAFLGTVISVILSFKLCQSYDRCWDARKIGDSIVNDSRSFVLQLQSFVKKGNEHSIREITFRHIAWCYSLGQSLTNLNPLENLEKHISPDQLTTIGTQKNKPLALLQLNGLQVADLKGKEQLDIFSQIQINNTLVNFSNSMGVAERIKNTVFPSTYRLFLHFLIYIFVITLCIALRDIQIHFEIPLLLAISSAFFLLEKSATIYKTRSVKNLLSQQLQLLLKLLKSISNSYLARKIYLNSINCIVFIYYNIINTR
jgi:ion channel-forming bestrophin family protein